MSLNSNLSTASFSLNSNLFIYQLVFRPSTTEVTSFQNMFCRVIIRVKYIYNIFYSHSYFFLPINPSFMGDAFSMGRGRTTTPPPSIKIFDIDIKRGIKRLLYLHIAYSWYFFKSALKVPEKGLKLTFFINPKSYILNIFQKCLQKLTYLFTLFWYPTLHMWKIIYFNLFVWGYQGVQKSKNIFI